MIKMFWLGKEDITQELDEDILAEEDSKSDVWQVAVDILEDKQYENEHIILTGIEKLKRIDLLTMINEIMKNKLQRIIEE